MQLTRFKKNWLGLRTSDREIEVNTISGTHRIEIPSSGKYAFFEGELLEIKDNSKKVLLVSDLDRTVFHDSPEGLAAHKEFIKFWIQHFEFNGSILVYDTGRSLNEYEWIIDKLYEPDLLVAVLGNYALTFDEEGHFVHEEDYKEVLNWTSNPNWDENYFVDAILEKFQYPRSYISRINPFTILFIIPDDVFFATFDEVKRFVKNKENIETNGKILKGKCIKTRCNLVGSHYIEVLPTHTGKQLGVIYAQKRYNFTDKDTMVAGDSLNDCMLLRLPVFGILVGNSENYLVDWFNKKPRPNKFHSNAMFALALIDGLKRFTNL
ncbi:hypothetical protein SteCoe_21526 [Stentor coeruleus]|uniref:Sucrose phosphatase-like domain-containing protein n=1 Tax=Stentor coeruleus TaxID=5963 RepID=A0A1R2BP76_9CILI|nr:hypothetical protein SteCoe_21526 [Stentor coeruleus]